MSKLVRSCCMFFGGKRPFRSIFLITGLVLTAGIAHGQDGRKVPISFVPPPLENATYSLGIYEAKSGKLVRRLQEIAPESAFTVGLNGLITSWDGKDDTGKPVESGQYAAHGYAVGAIKVEGVNVLGNDWTSEDGDLRVTQVDAIVLVPQDEGVVMIVETVDRKHFLLRYAGKDGALLWQKPIDWGHRRGRWDLLSWFYVLSVDDANVSAREEDMVQVVRLADGENVVTQHSPIEHPPDRNAFASSLGKDGTFWQPMPDKEGGGLLQFQLRPEEVVSGKPPAVEKLDRPVLRRLPVQVDGPSPWMVSASTVHDKIYVAEGGNWQVRVRGLAWLETKEEGGKQVSTWQTFFERGLRPPDPSLGLEAARDIHQPSPTVEMILVRNPLSPGKSDRCKLTASLDEKGSYLAGDGLRLRQISQRERLRGIKLARGKKTGELVFFQTDEAAWDEFSISGAQNMMAFDAGEFEMTAEGEKTHTAKPAEPPDL